MPALSNTNSTGAPYAEAAIVCPVHDVTNGRTPTSSPCVCHIKSAFRWLNGPVLGLWQACESSTIHLELSGPQGYRIYHIFLTLLTKRPAEPCLKEASFSGLDVWRAVQKHERCGPAATLLRGLLCKIFLNRELDVPVAKIEEAAYVVEAVKLPSSTAITNKKKSSILEGFPEDREVIIPVILVTFNNSDMSTVVFAPLATHLGLPAIFRWLDFMRIVSKTVQEPKTMDLESCLSFDLQSESDHHTPPDLPSTTPPQFPTFGHSIHGFLDPRSICPSERAPTPSSPPPKPALLNLPIELLIDIIEFLQDNLEDFQDYLENLRSFRCCSKRFAEVGARVLFKELHVALYLESILRLTNIASRHNLATSVQRVVFHGQVPFGYETIKGWAIAVGRAGGQVPRWKRDDYYETYISYADAEDRSLTAQESMSKGIDLAGAKLQDVVVTAYDEADDRSAFWDKVRENILLTPTTWRRRILDDLDENTPEGRMLCAIRYDAKTFYPDLFAALTEGSVLLTATFRALTTCSTELRRLQMTTTGGEFWCQRVNGNNWPQGPPLIPTLYPVFVFLTVLDLKKLNLHVKLALNIVNDTVEGEWPRGDILACVGKWPRIRKLSLEIDATQPSLIDCFNKLAGFLDTLRLHNVRLLPTAAREEWELLCDRCRLPSQAQEVGCWGSTIRQLSRIKSLKGVEFSDLGEISMSDPTATVFRVFTNREYVEYMNQYVLGRKGDTDWFNADQDNFLETLLGGR
ncbi:uncharacterized protein BDZ99DRAFT_524142 [Mytilinidion resinicola]|uniref:Uncharacterized protein n=1 Tax=Mytilinidion resinicola TaxID=574789 RepID=A0A6A6YBE3_9PEZI|nr:uncharacterized protein BDZ99DRAFT_524142 [Mytilinidion resinicola]KAF2805898.1 hypothetical protein BDZ99DRAFT_524142 [Mytilinidion resinicola]